MNSTLHESVKADWIRLEQPLYQGRSNVPTLEMHAVISLLQLASAICRPKCIKPLKDEHFLNIARCIDNFWYFFAS